MSTTFPVQAGQTVTLDDEDWVVEALRPEGSRWTADIRAPDGAEGPALRTIPVPPPYTPGSPF